MIKEHYIYKITNLINDKYYYGKRSCKGLAIHDKYMGSGTHLQHAKIKYGIENFKKEILAYCESSDDALELEELVVTETEVNDPQCYNMKCGGIGGGGKPSEETRAKISASNKGKHSIPLSDEHKAKISAGNLGKTNSAETRAKMSAVLKGRTISDEHRAKLSAVLKGRTRKPFSDEHKAKLSAAKRDKPRSEETRAKMSIAKQNMSDETKAKMSAAKLGKKRGPYKKQKGDYEND